MCNSKPITLFQQVEIPVPVGAGAKVPIPDQPQLRQQADQKIYTQKVEVYTAIVSPVSPNGVTNAPTAELAKAVLVLYVLGEEKIYRIPLFALNEINDGTNPYKQQIDELDNLQVDWAKSYLQYSSAPAATPYAVLIGVKYARQMFNS